MRRESALQDRVFRSSKVKGFSLLVLRLTKRPLPRTCNSFVKFEPDGAALRKFKQRPDLEKVEVERWLKRARTISNRAIAPRPVMSDLVS